MHTYRITPPHSTRLMPSTCGPRIFRGLAFGVVLASDGGPISGFHVGRQPEPQTKEMARDRMQAERMVCLMAVQEHCDGDNCDVGQHQRHHYVAPRWQVEYAGQYIEP